MLLTISTTYQPATDLGYLLHKNPVHLQTFSLNFGQAHVFYPEASVDHCTVALLLDIDTIELVRGKGKTVSSDQYVNARPYVASSFLSVAIANIFSSALNGRCTQRPELVATPMPLRAQIAAISCHRGEDWLHRLFEPLGYAVEIMPHLLDEQHPEWGPSAYFTVTLQANCCIRDLLTHLYVLIPVLDNSKHYWVGDDEVEKLLLRGQGWLEKHPEREQITKSYLRNMHDLTSDALARLVVEDDISLPTEIAVIDRLEPIIEQVKISELETVQEAVKKPESLHEQRLLAVMDVLKQSGARRVLDLGCGEGRLLKKLLQERNIEHILGLDVSYKALELAQKSLHIENLSPRQRERLTLIHGALTYRDKRLAGYDAAAVVEVIEHLDPPRLSAFERVLFEFAHPATVVITTPNAEYNVKYETLHAGTFRHQDHRFEWTRVEFQRWAQYIAERFGYVVHFLPVGSEDAEVGSPSQMGVFSHSLVVKGEEV